ncbi:putative MFS family arabinose efflux permease [Kibdelosporangium banguiense]|uniref:MFS family arabinose efflux permease n=1 Tax=Kibdelosporangium banguiense TaxID=1365924 RepID=A0ABS4TS59_9PSEU|nr:MFS transporter [Kibdelosporangium banguiense]MBP2327232.1 putative MFS family arabinose efflux permease [Kibdelosporangium banguiense]
MSRRSPLVSWLAVTSVMLGIFSIGTSGNLPIGLLTSIGATYHISDGTAGLMMTVPGFLAAISAPTLTVATRTLDRRFMLAVLMIMLAGANFLAAVAPAYWMMVISRVVVGFVIGAFWSIGSGLSSRLVPADQVPRATSVIFSAVPLSSVLGVPAGTFIGDQLGWRAAFVAMGLLTIGILAMLLAFVPALPAVEVTKLNVLGDMLRDKMVRVGLVVTFLVVLAHFGAYTYVRPFLEDVTKVGPGLITVLLFIYGLAGIVGNFVAGAMAARNVRRTVIIAACMIAVATALLPVIGKWDAGAIVLLIVWGVAYGGVPVCSQTWFRKSYPQGTEAASVLFTASFQATFSVGALLGGVVVDASSPSIVMVCGAVTAVLMTLAVLTLSRPGQPG